jgi:sulfide:quinone oxidoreductase
MKLRVVVLGAGFGGLELTSILSEEMGDHLDLTLIDKSDAFVFGFSKFEVMFGRKPAEAVRIPYRSIVKPGVDFRQETITAIHPETRRVITDAGTYDADILVVALGADYDLNATPGMVEGGEEFYSFAGVERLREVLPNFTKGHVVIGVASTPYKCPPAPSEAALLLHDYLTERGVRDDCTISLVIPFDLPIPPSPESSEGLINEFTERSITFTSNRFVKALDPERGVVILNDGMELPYDLFLGIPKHCAPQVVADSGMTEDGWIPVNPKNLKTRFDGVYAIGDVTSVGTPKAGEFAENAGRAAAHAIIAELQGGPEPEPFKGTGTCYIEFGGGRVGRVDVEFLSGDSPRGIFTKPSDELVSQKQLFGSKRRTRWFGLE